MDWFPFTYETEVSDTVQKKIQTTQKNRCRDAFAFYKQRGGDNKLME